MRIPALPHDRHAARRAEQVQGGLIADWRRWSRAERVAVILAGLITLGLVLVFPFVV